jgi:hypothetical protein
MITSECILQIPVLSLAEDVGCNINCFRYHDLTIAFGTNYKAAIRHYLSHGQTEHRLGYQEGGDGERWTASNANHDLFVSASQRMGGAIDSVVWNNKEFVNAYDHGRELQMAANTNTYGECYNPTEAGGRDDSNHDNTKTHIQSIQAHGNVLETQVCISD